MPLRSRASLSAALLVCAGALAGCPPVPAPVTGTKPVAASQPATEPTSQPALLVEIKEELAKPAEVGTPQKIPAPKEMAATAAEMVARGERLFGRTQALHEYYRGLGDEARRDCVGEKLIRIKGNLLDSQAAREALSRALDRGDNPVTFAELTRIGVAWLKVRTAAAELEICALAPPRTGTADTAVAVEPDKVGGP